MLKPRSGPTNVGPDLGSSLFASSIVLFLEHIARIDIFQTDADDFSRRPFCIPAYNRLEELSDIGLHFLNILTNIWASAGQGESCYQDLFVYSVYQSTAVSYHWATCVQYGTMEVVVIICLPRSCKHIWLSLSDTYYPRLLFSNRSNRAPTLSWK